MQVKPKKKTSDQKPSNFSEELARAVLNSLSAHIALLDEKGIILEVNKAWRDYAVKNGVSENFDFTGINYLDICDAARGEDAADARSVSEGIRSVIDGKVEEFLHDYPCHSESSRHWYYMRGP